MNEKICIGILTSDRSLLFDKLIASIKDIIPNNDLIITENSKELYAENIILKNQIVNFNLYKINVIPKDNNINNINIARNKNIILKQFLEFSNSNYLFLLEDDIEIIDTSIFNDYINLSKTSKIEHFCFGFGGDCNIVKIDNNNIRFKYNPIISTKYDIIYFKHAVGVFCFYTRNILEKIGLFDENFNIGFDHIDHSFRIMSYYKLPFLYPDYKYSYKKIRDNDSDLKNSILRKIDNFTKRQEYCIRLFNNKHKIDYLNIFEKYYNNYYNKMIK